MKIEWIHAEERDVPKLGLMTAGLIKDVDKEIGESLIQQGLARRPQPKKIEKEKDKPPEIGGKK